MLQTIPSTDDPKLLILYGSSFALTANLLSLPTPPGKERITHAALRVSNELTAAVEAPGRHHHIINTLGGSNILSAELLGRAEQGFMTTDGRFVGRELGLLIANHARQIVCKTPPKNQLFSEDLW